MSLILSLDLTCKNTAIEIFNKVKKELNCVKIGHVFSPYITINEINKSFENTGVFLDFKLLDIPNTVYLAIKNYQKQINNLKYITIHGTAEDEMIEKALSACNKAKILSVISLTSNTLNKELFLQQAQRNLKLGIKGFICPATMLKDMRKEFGEGIELISPGIRLANKTKNDHKECQTPFNAYKDGANSIVVGRPIIEAKNPCEEVKKFLKQETIKG